MSWLFDALCDEFEKLATAPVAMYVVPINRIGKKGKLDEESRYSRARGHVMGGLRGALTGAGAAGVYSALRGRDRASRAVLGTATALGTVLGVGDKMYQRHQNKKTLAKMAMVIKTPHVNPMQPLLNTPGRLARSAKMTGAPNPRLSHFTAAKPTAPVQTGHKFGPAA